MRAAGELIHRYEIVSLLGHGGMGEVYEAEDTVLKRRVALKLIPGRGDADARERMLREARAAATFTHPHIVTVFDAGVVGEGTAEEETFLAMELVRGASLREKMADGAVSLEQRLRWLHQMSTALAAAHAASLVHRDIKPDNVMVREDGTVKILDFGIAKRSQASIDPSAPTEIPTGRSLTGAGGFVGTPRYAAPEQLRGEPVDGRCDQYAFGATAYELLSGKPPFDGDSGVALLSRILTEPPAPLTSPFGQVPVEVEAAILRCLAKDQAGRFSSMAELEAVLSPYSTSTAQTAPLSAAPPPRHSISRRLAMGAKRGVLMLATGIGLLILGLIAVGAMMGKLRISGLERTTASAAPVVPAARGLRCEPARPKGAFPAGTEPDAQTLAAVGIGACVRLAAELALPWGHPNATDRGAVLADYEPVLVDLSADAKVDVALGLASAAAAESNPIRSVQKAVTELAGTLPARTLSAEQRADWGADNDAAALRVARTWRKLVIGALESPEEAARALALSDPDSPFSHAIVLLVEARGSAAAKDAATKLYARVDQLAPARAKALRAVAIAVTEPARKDEAVKLLRQSYRDAPNDADVAGLYAAIVLDTASQEGFAVIERIAQDFPTYAHVPLTNAVTAVSIRDPQRNQKYLARLVEIQPEKECEEIQFGELIIDQALEEVRARLLRCKRLFGSDNTFFLSALVEASVELAALDPQRALALTAPLLGDPRDSVRNEAIRLTLAAKVLGGQFRQAKEDLLADMRRLKDQESPQVALQRGAALLRLQWQLGETPEPRVLAEVIQLADSITGMPPLVRARVDSLLLRIAKPDREADTKTTEALAMQHGQDGALYGIALLRRLHGDKKALSLLGQHGEFGTRSRIVNALEFAVLLEATGASDELIEQQYRLAMVPVAVDICGFDKIAARVRLAQRLEARGKMDEANQLRVEVARAWAHADPGLSAVALRLH